MFNIQSGYDFALRFYFIFADHDFYFNKILFLLKKPFITYKQ